MGFALRSILLSKGIDDVTVAKDPHAVLPDVTPADEATGRTAGTRLLGFAPFESPLRPGEGLERRPPEAPLGFIPSRASRQQPCRRLITAGSSRVLGLPAPTGQARMHLGVSISHCLTLPKSQGT